MQEKNQETESTEEHSHLPNFSDGQKFSLGDCKSEHIQ